MLSCDAHDMKVITVTVTIQLCDMYVKGTLASTKRYPPEDAETQGWWQVPYFFFWRHFFLGVVGHFGTFRRYLV